jgi:hypothetical protein
LNKISKQGANYAEEAFMAPDKITQAEAILKARNFQNTADLKKLGVLAGAPLSDGPGMDDPSRGVATGDVEGVADLAAAVPVALPLVFWRDIWRGRWFRRSLPRRLGRLCRLLPPASHLTLSSLGGFGDGAG